ncbi:hypothetical protein [Desulfurobacterium atlanticum]|uniref:Uncharacterized protein n=1 Tax=Desulfurobacterium atlanticum TaxID=240169 RepID=A0A238XTR4_9BACT|nr:hypothetical protein [Desulfurobacterium atlanticum]SNR61843.1 hypothetical protein SAMN06265340_101231 [Desulfurobacterium atlanticum]
MKVVSRIDGRVRIKFDNIYEQRSFVENISKIPGVINIETGKALSALVIYKSGSPADFVLRNLRETEEVVRAGREEIYHYGNAVLTHPAAKALWTVMWLGFRRGIVTFAACSLILNRYIKAAFEK